MVTNAEEPQPEPEVTIADRLYPVGRGVRVLATGSANGPWRRSVLYFAVAAALAFTTPVFVGVVGLVALLALALTDAIVDLRE